MLCLAVPRDTPGPVLDTLLVQNLSVERAVNNLWMEPKPRRHVERNAKREDVAVPARLTWKDSRGMTRFASVVTRNISDLGVYVECTSPVSIPLYRLVQFQLEREARDTECLPRTIRQGRVLSAVYRITPPVPGSRQGLALRLMSPSKRDVSVASIEVARAATA